MLRPKYILAGEDMEKEKRVNMKQIAERLNISAGSVSLTLNGRGDEMRISEETQKLILDTAKEMGYPLEKVRKKRQTVGVNNLPVIVVFIPILSEGIISPYDRIMSGLNQCMKECGLNLEILVCPFEYNKLSEKYRYFSDKFCTGAIVFSVSETDLDELLLQNFEIPVVLFNRLNNKYPTVYIDDYEAGYQVAKIFYEKSFEKAAMFTPDYKSKPILLRKMGFEAGCEHYGIELPERYNIVCGLSGKEIEACVDDMSVNNRIPQVVFANMDDLGLRVLMVLKEKGIKVPDEVEVVLYGNHAWTKLVASEMNCIPLDIEGISAECLNVLWQMIESGNWTAQAKVYQKNQMMLTK